jgi:small subunit ribosomal protein S18
MVVTAPVTRHADPRCSGLPLGLLRHDPGGASLKGGDMAAQGKNRNRTKPNDAKNRLRRGRPKVCLVCAQQIAWVDYKDTNLLRRFMTDRGKIKARANTGTCRQHQRDVALAIKSARELAMLPYLVRTLAADNAGRRGRGRPGDRPGGADSAPTPTTDIEAAPAVSADVEAGTAPDDATTTAGVPSLADLQPD